MSLPNYATLFFPTQYYFQIPFFHYPLVEQQPEKPSPLIKVEENGALPQEKKCFFPLQEPKLQIVEQNLRKIHYLTEQYRKCHWTAEQDKLLEKLVEVQKLEWKQIPKYFKQRTQNMCYSRYRRISMSTKDRLWTKQQETIVIDLVNEHGQKWKLISKNLPITPHHYKEYTPKQIRERYLNYLRPSIVRQEFQLEEDLKICRYLLEKGKHWRKMEEVLPGRSQGCIKGRYYEKLQKIIEQSRGASKS